MQKNWHKLIRFLVVFALVTAGISPACRFIAGKEMPLEICGSQGLKTVYLAADGSGLSLNSEQTKSSGKQKNSCPFCIHAFKSYDSLGEGVSFAWVDGASVPYIPSQVDRIAYKVIYDPTAPRGPPFFVAV